MPFFFFFLQHSPALHGHSGPNGLLALKPATVEGEHARECV